MLEILSGNAEQGYYKLYRLPTLGYLSKSGKRLIVGDMFNQADINAGQIRYTHEVPFASQETEALDFFEFTLWDHDNKNITAASYSACMPVGIDVPVDGIYRFPIHIVTPTEPTVVVWNGVIPIRELSVTKLTGYLSASEAGYASDDLVHTAEPMTYGFISVRGITSNSFTQADVDAGDVTYTNTSLGNGMDTLRVTTCNMQSRCSSSQLSFQITPIFRQTGDNVIYAEPGSVIVWEFKSNVEEALWEIKGGSLNPPPQAKPRANYIIEWSTYAETSDLPANSPERGHGYDKLEEYRNLKETYYWDGGLPLGTLVSSVGYLSSAERSPMSVAGTQPWRLPLHLGSYPFTLKATDPKTGETDIRRYQIVLTETGLNIDGLASESKSL